MNDMNDMNDTNATNDTNECLFVCYRGSWSSFLGD